MARCLWRGNAVAALSLIAFSWLSPVRVHALSAQKELIQELSSLSVGGAAAVARLRNCTGLAMSGEMSMTGTQGNFDFCYRAPDSFFLRLIIGPMTVERWYDGSHGFQRSAGGIVTTFSGSELEQFLIESRVQAYTYIRPDSKVTLSLGATTSWQGRPAQELVVSSATDTVRLIIDSVKKTLLSKIGKLDNIVTEENTDSLGQFDSIILPQRSTTFLRGTGLSNGTVISSLQLNQPCAVWSGIPAELSTAHTYTPAPERKIKFSLVDGHIYLPVTLKGGKKGMMLLDSGASSNFLLRSVVDELGLAVTGQLPSRGVAGFEMIGLLNVDSLMVGDQIQPTLPFGVTSLDMLERKSVNALPCVGILGYEFLARQVITIDYFHLTVRLHRNLRDLSPTAYEIPFTLFLNLPIVKGAINSVDGSFLVDVGNAGGVIVHEPFARAHDLLDPSAASISGFGGIGGELTGWPITLSHFTLSASDREFAVDSVKALVTSGSYGLSGSVDVDGNIGGVFLQDYAVTFDYAHSRLFLEPHSR